MRHLLRMNPEFSEGQTACSMVFFVTIARLSAQVQEHCFTCSAGGFVSGRFQYMVYV